MTVAVVTVALLALVSAHSVVMATVSAAQTAPVETTEQPRREVTTRRVVERIEGRERPGFTVPIAVALLALALIVQIRYLLKRANEPAGPDALPVPPPALAAMARTTARVTPAPAGGAPAPAPVPPPDARPRPAPPTAPPTPAPPTPAPPTPSDTGAGNEPHPAEPHVVDMVRNAGAPRPTARSAPTSAPRPEPAYERWLAELDDRAAG